MSVETGVAAYEVGATVASAQLRNGLAVIADAANYLAVGRNIWRKVAEDAEVPLKVIEVTCSDAGLHRARLEGRRRGLSKYPEPSWNDVVRRAAETEPWTCPRLVVDSSCHLNDIVDAALAYLDT